MAAEPLIHQAPAHERFVGRSPLMRRSDPSRPGVAVSCERHLVLKNPANVLMNSATWSRMPNGAAEVAMGEHWG